MDAILKYVLAHMSFLYKDFDCRIIDSMHSDSFGGEGLLTFRCNDFELRIVKDRGDLFLDFRSPKFDKRHDDWHSFDVVRQLITGQVQDRSILGADCVIFVRENFDSIRELFSRKNAGKTVAALKKLEKERAKRLFG